MNVKVYWLHTLHIKIKKINEGFLQHSRAPFKTFFCKNEKLYVKLKVIIYIFAQLLS